MENVENHSTSCVACSSWHYQLDIFLAGSLQHLIGLIPSTATHLTPDLRATKGLSLYSKYPEPSPSAIDPTPTTRNARCAPFGQPGQPIAKPLFHRDFNWLAHKLRLANLANQSNKPPPPSFVILTPAQIHDRSEVGPSNFTIGPSCALNLRTNPNANFVIGTPDPSSNTSPTKPPAQGIRAALRFLSTISNSHIRPMLVAN